MFTIHHMAKRKAKASVQTCKFNFLLKWKFQLDKLDQTLDRAFIKILWPRNREHYIQYTKKLVSVSTVYVTSLFVLIDSSYIKALSRYGGTFKKRKLFLHLLIPFFFKGYGPEYPKLCQVVIMSVLNVFHWCWNWEGEQLLMRDFRASWAQRRMLLWLTDFSICKIFWVGHIHFQLRNVFWPQQHAGLFSIPCHVGTAQGNLMLCSDNTRSCLFNRS